MTTPRSTSENAKGSSLRVVFVDDDPVILEGLARMLDGMPSARLVGAFADAESALAAFDEGVEAEVVLIDLGLPRMSGVELIRRLSALRPEAAFVVLTVFDDDDHLFGALRAGASGYLLKDASKEGLLRCIEEAGAGGAPMSPGIARRVLKEFRAAGSKTSSSGKSEGLVQSPLTPREVEVLDLLARGFTYETIGRGLGIACGTVQTHIRCIYRKLEVATKSEATAEGYRRGLLT